MLLMVCTCHRVFIHVIELRSVWKVVIYYLHQEGYVFAFVFLSVSRITQKLSTNVDEFFGRGVTTLHHLVSVKEHLWGSLSLRFNGHFPGEPGLAGVYWSKDDGSGGDNWSYKSCKAPAKLSPPTNQHPVLFTGRMPFLSPNQQRQSTERKNITFHGLAYTKLTWGFSSFVSDSDITLAEPHICEVLLK